MADFQFDREKHIALSGKIYDRAEFSPEIQQLIGTINFSDQEIATQQTNLEIYRYGRDRMVQTLLSQVEESGVKALADVPAEEPAE